MKEKKSKLENFFYNNREFIIAFSGGVDSTFLLFFAKKFFIEHNIAHKIFAVTVNSDFFTEEEILQSKNLAKKIKCFHEIVDVKLFVHDEIIENTPERCYHCKKIIFSEIKKFAKQKKISTIIDGTNFDDNFDYRPGLRAIKEFHVKSPLRDAGFSKKEIVQLSQELNVPLSDFSSTTCLATRIPYFTKITREELFRIKKAEDFIKSFGFKTVRVRSHGEIARIEILRNEFNNLINNYSKKIINELKKIGYKYITLDIEGFNSGSMNRILPTLTEDKSG